MILFLIQGPRTCSAAGVDLISTDLIKELMSFEGYRVREIQRSVCATRSQESSLAELTSHVYPVHTMSVSRSAQKNLQNHEALEHACPWCLQETVGLIFIFSGVSSKVRPLAR